MRLTLKQLVIMCGVGLAQASTGAHADARDDKSAATTPPAAKVSRVTGVAPDPNWAEEYAYALGVQAYTYAFPWYYNALLRWKWTTQPAPNERTPSMAINTFWHNRLLADASYRDGGSVNNDTLYSTAWVDLRKEPVIISVPDVGARYFSVELAGFDSDNFAYLGTRTTGTKAGSYALVGPQWKGKLPSGVKAITPAPTPVIFVVVRLLTDGPEDLDIVHRLQDQTTLTPLSLWGKKNAKTPDNRDAFAPYNPKQDPMAEWKTINRAMTEVPPPARDADVLAQFAKIGIGPGQDVDKVDDATRRGLLRALDTGKRVVTGAASNAASSSRHNGWRIFDSHLGHFGDNRDFIGRAGPQSLGGIVANNPEEAMYPQVMHDATGERLNGSHRYVLHFDKDALPPVKAFWSLTAYGMDFNMIDNPINRYSLGDRSKAMKRDADGGLTLYVQKDAPGADKNDNWLPSGDSEFFLTLRLYLPERAALEKHWLPPAIQRID